MRLTFYRSGAKRAYSKIPPLTGTIVAYAGSSAPDGWLLCSGGVVSTTTYADLNNVIKTNFNTGGESAGTFRLPDFRSRAPIGAGTGTGGGASGTGLVTGGTALTARTIGQQVGSLGVTLTAAQSGFPTHNHPVTESDHGTTQGAHPLTADGNHRHLYGIALTDGFKSGGGYVNWFPEQPYNQYGAGSPYNTTNQYSGGNTYTINSSTSNIHDGSNNANVVGYKSANAVGAHPNIQPSLVVNYIIKT